MGLKFKGSLGFVVLELVGGSSEFIRYINKEDFKTRLKRAY